MKYFKENNELFNSYLKSFVNNQLILNYLKIIEGEYYNYYGINARNNPLKFLILLFINKFYKKNFDIIINTNLSSNKFLFIKTANYLFNDNLVPIIEKLENLNYGYNILGYKKSKINFRIFNFKYSKIYFNRVCYKNIYNFITTLYIQQYAFPQVDLIIEHLERLELKDRLIISADPADLLSRSAYFVSQKINSKLLLIQSGPVTSKTIEWSSICCNSISCWHNDEQFFKNIINNAHSFFPPRFYYIHNLEYKQEIDVLIILPWLHNDKSGKEIQYTIECIINFLHQKLLIKPHIKFHPAGKLNLNSSKNYYSIINENNLKKVLPSAKKILHFGSTAMFDCIYLNILCGAINFNKQIPSEILDIKNKNSILINTYDDLSNFMKIDLFESKNTSINYDLVDFITNYKIYD